MRKTLPSQFDQPEVRTPTPDEQPLPQPFLKIAGLDRVVRPDHLAAIVQSQGNVHAHFADGSIHSIRKYTAEGLASLVGAPMPNPFIGARTRGVSGTWIWVNPNTLEGYADSGAQLLLYFRSGNVVAVPGFTSEDLVPALDAAGLLVLSEATPR